MSGDVMGGGVVIAIAAGLWIAYLLPTWLRRREYLTTERNAVRLQQTLRILAATSELPDEVRLEANARTVAEQQRILRRAEEQSLAEARADAHAKVAAERAEQKRAAAEEAARARVAEAAARAAAAQSVLRATALAAQLADPEPEISGGVFVDAGAGAGLALPVRSVGSRSRTLRRARASTSLVMLIALIAIGFGVSSLVTGGSWELLACGTAALAGSFVVLGRLARAGRRAVAAPIAVARPIASELYDHGFAEGAPEEQVSSTWTPQPLPKPLHLSRGTIAASAMASIDAAAELRRAAARADLDRKAAELQPEVTPIRPAAAVEPPVWAEAPAAARGVSEQADAGDPVSARPAVSAPPSRFAEMGLVDDGAVAAIDLDAAFRRRAAS